MIKRALLFTLCCIAGAFGLNAQTCTPAQNFPMGAIAVPASWSPERLDAGIRDTACINSYYEFTLSVRAPGSIPSLPGVTINSIAIPAQNGVTNLPVGLSYVCNPPNCVFPRDSLSCVKVFGTPTDPGDIGQKDLTLLLTINTTFGQLSNIPYPNEQLDPGGHYYLHVKAEGSSGCFIFTSTSEETAQAFSVTARPNPTTGFMQISVQSAQSGLFDFQISDMTGRPVHRERVPLYAGENTLHYDGSMLPAGMYVYSLSNGSETVTHKLVISRN